MKSEAMHNQIQSTPLRRVVLKDRVSELIKDAILTGKLGPGDRIVEMKLASELGVATTSVREGLLELEAQGFVTRFTNRGTFVTELTRDDVDQILSVRHELEGMAAELASKRVSPEDIVTLRQLVNDMDRSARTNDLTEFYRADVEFHRTIWVLTGNRHLVKALDTTVGPLFAFFIVRNPARTMTELLNSVDWHARVVDAIEAQENPRRTMEEALGFFRRQEHWAIVTQPEDHSPDAMRSPQRVP